MKIIFLLIILISSSAFSQSLEIKNSALLIKSRDRINLGQYLTSKNLNPQINLKIPLVSQSFFAELEYGQLENINFFNGALGYKLKLKPDLLTEFSIGFKDFYYFNTINGDPLLDKKGVPYFLFRGHLALFKISGATIIGDGLVLYGVKTDDFRANEIGIGLSAGFRIDSSYYHRVGYRLEHQATFDNVESNSIFKNVLYYKINF